MVIKFIPQVFGLVFTSISLFSQVTTLSGYDNKTPVQNTHPHILVKPDDKQAILQKIAQQDWAGKSYAKMKRRLIPYVERHKIDPDWILSRYLMNRVPGKRYTDFQSDADGTELVSYSGDAPFPTVRVAPHKRQPISKDGYSFKQPAIEELVPYDTSMLMYMTVNAPVKRKEWANPQTFVDNINQQINDLALDAAIIYWLEEDPAYAKFAADILSQWARGAYYQHPITGPCRTGFLSIQTLGDGSYEPMPLIYDFLYYYLRKNKYETQWYEPVFDKTAHTMTFRGFWNNNWFAAQTPALVFSALSLENKNKQSYYLNFVMEKDTINESCGHLSMPSIVKNWLTPDGHWKEPGGYHNYPVNSLLVSGVALEKNGYNVFQKFPALIQASYVMLKYSFPNIMASTFGDTGPASQSPQSLEIGLMMAQNYHLAVFPQMMSAMKVLLDEKGYKREESDYLGLLCYLPVIQATNKTSTYSWPRSGKLDFAKAYYQRNGTERKNGLMYVVQGASYNHNHANGMSMELYGKGSVMGPDPGNGLTYEDSMHVGYYAQWGAHNTVIAGGLSSAIPEFKGGGGAKQIGEIELIAMEPRAEDKPISEMYSFTTTHYVDKVTQARQERTMAIVRTSPTTGYYLDIFRSNHPQKNEYIYHNVGKELKLMNERWDPIRLSDSINALVQEKVDPAGLRHIKQLKSTGIYASSIIGIFSMEDEMSELSKRYMKVLVPGVKGRNYFVGMAPPTKTVLPLYNTLPTPTLIIRQTGEAWSQPFVALFEPYSGDNSNVFSAKFVNNKNPQTLTALNVKNKNNTEQFIFQSADKNILYQESNWSFKGVFGMINLLGDKPEELYLGDGNEISYGDFSITSTYPNATASMKIKNKRIVVNCKQNVIIRIRNKRLRVAASKETIIPY